VNEEPEILIVPTTGKDSAVRARRTVSYALATTLAAAGLTLAAAPAQAISACLYGYYCATDYYSNAQHTELVGQRIEDYCSGEPTTSTWGEQNGYFVVVDTAC
jgi:Family of unknown function (DUF6289)